jgi:membrane glycosyltransferase
MEAAGLPELPGKPPFGGHILSHDFVEAALIRRAGWTVRIAPDIGGSYEEAPPTLVDFAARDRRWCQGNLQHVRVVSARGLHWMSRFHLVSGIFSYAASLLWLLLIAAGLTMAVQAAFTPPDYFEDPHQLFPTWPRIDSALQIELLLLTLLLLLGPKLFGLAVAIARRDDRRQAGGALRLFASFVTELVISALIAPIMMLIQSWFVVAILSGADAGWSPQRRDNGECPLRQALRAHRWHMLIGLGLVAAAWWVAPMLLAWLAPAVVGLVLAAPVSSFTASARAGEALRRWGLLVTPEERIVPEILRVRAVCQPLHRVAVLATPDVRGFVADDCRRRFHLVLLDPAEDEASGEIDPLEAVAAAKIGRARSLDEAVSILRPDEQSIALARPELFNRLSSLASSVSPWPPAPLQPTGPTPSRSAKVG